MRLLVVSRPSEFFVEAGDCQKLQWLETAERLQQTCRHSLKRICPTAHSLYKIRVVGQDIIACRVTRVTFLIRVLEISTSHLGELA